MPRGEIEMTIKALMTAADTKAAKAIELRKLDDDAALLVTLRVKCIAMETALLTLARELYKASKDAQATE